MVSDSKARGYDAFMPQGAMLRDQVRAAILATAARALAERGDEVTLADVASAAGVARSTLYRYFPNRDALLHALTEAGAGEVSTLLGDAELDRLPATEALARVTRGLIATGAKYVALTRLRPKTDDAAEAEIAGLLVKLFRRGALEGAFRNDLPRAMAISSMEPSPEAASRARASKTPARPSSTSS